MDPEEIAKLVKNLKLSQLDKAPHVILPPDLESLGKKRLESCLVGKVFSSKAVNRDVFRANMPRILQAIKAIDIEMVGENLFLLNFKALADKNRALTEGPWNFFKDLVLFAEPHGLQNPNDISFREVPLWVQFHNLPLAFMQPEILRNLGDTIGKVLEVEGGERGTCSGRFARLRILKKLDTPLDKGICVSLTDSTEETCIILLYEKLPNYCFACGRLGHVVRDCEDVAVDKISLQFGNWLRAPPMNPARRAGSSRNRNSEPSVPSGVGEGTESPPISDHDKHNPVFEALQLTSDDVIQCQFAKEKNIKMPLLRDASSETVGVLQIAEPIESGVCSIPDAPMNLDLIINTSVKKASPDKQIKSSKQWKRLARGMVPLTQSSADTLLTEQNGKRSWEIQETTGDFSKKFKTSKLSNKIVVSDSAVAAGQSRRSL